MSEALKLDKHKSILGLLNDTSVYGIGMVLSRFMAFIITPIITRLFSIKEYGQLDIIMSSLSIAIAFSSLYTESALMKYYYSYERKEQRSLLFTHILTMATVSLTLIFFLLPISGFLASKLLGSASLINVIRSSLAIIITSLIYQHIITVLRTTRRAKMSIVYSLSVAVLQFLLVLLFVLEFNYGIEGIFMSRALAEGFVSAIVIFIIRDDYYPSYSLSILKNLLRFSIPLFPEILMGIIIGYSSKYFILIYHGAAPLGIFALAQKGAALVVIASAALKSAWLPYAFSISGQDKNKEIYSYVFSAYLKVMALIVASLIIFSRELILVLATKEYLSAMTIMGLLGITSALQGLVYILNTGILISGKTKYYMIASLMALVVTLVAGVVLIPVWGVTGAAMVHLAAQIVMVGMIYKIAGRLYKIDYQIGYLGLFIVGMLMLSTININGFPSIGLIFKLLLFSILGIAGFLMLRKEIEVIKKIVLGRLRFAS